jgi:hypothetical protein
MLFFHEAEWYDSESKWVASKVVSILRDYPKMGAKEFQEKLQNDRMITRSQFHITRFGGVKK